MKTYCIYVKKGNDMELYRKNLTETQAKEEADQYYREHKASAIILKES